MERTMSVEEKIRRAEEIYEKRKHGSEGQINTVNLNRNKKELKLFKKMVIQMLVCLCIYFIIHTIHNSNYIFSKDFIDKTNEIISYDTDFLNIYKSIIGKIEDIMNNKNINNEELNKRLKEKKNNQNEHDEKKESGSEKNEDNTQEAIGGAEEVEQQSNETIQLSQTEQDIVDIKATTSFIKPIDGVISSKYGIRETATGNVPKNHTGTDIAANLGSKIKSSTDGEVVLSSEEGDYGKHLKIQLGEVSIVYAHCNNLYVKQGDKVVQGQEIAEVGSTGNSTGPHLHFEIRVHERTVDPESILEL